MCAIQVQENFGVFKKIREILKKGICLLPAWGYQQEPAGTEALGAAVQGVPAVCYTCRASNAGPSWDLPLTAAAVDWELPKQIEGYL